MGKTALGPSYLGIIASFKRIVGTENMPSIKVGNLAPSFTLLDQHGKQTKLSDYKGKKNVVLYFYPKAMTPGCTVQACGLRDSKNQLAKLDAVALGISPDSVKRLAKFEEKEDLNFSLLADEYMGIIRTSFIIDKQGRLVHIMDKIKTKSHHDDVLGLLNALP